MSTTVHDDRAKSPLPLTANRAEDVLAHVPSGADLIVPIAAGEPATLLDTLEQNYRQLGGVRIHRSHGED